MFNTFSHHHKNSFHYTCSILTSSIYGKIFIIILCVLYSFDGKLKKKVFNFLLSDGVFCLVQTEKKSNRLGAVADQITLPVLYYKVTMEAILRLHAYMYLLYTEYLYVTPY